MRLFVFLARRLLIAGACFICYAVGAWWQEGYPGGLGVMMVVSIAVFASFAVEHLGQEKQGPPHE
jgi:hypothetical protein